MIQLKHFRTALLHDHLWNIFYIPNSANHRASEMSFAHPLLNMPDSKHHMQLGPYDLVSFPAVYDANKVHCCVFIGICK